MYGVKATNVVNELLAHNILGATGKISIELLGVKCDVNDKSAVGNLLQEWLGAWMTSVGVYHRVNQNTQEFPDFYLSEAFDTDLLEVKTFDYSKAPNFDIANFDAYVRSLKNASYRLNADYLILGYVLTESELRIEKIWLKKIWEITCPSAQFSLKTQVKQGKIVNIRPYNFKNMSKGFQPFDDREQFVNAIRQTLAEYRMGTEPAEEWFQTVQANYASFYQETPPQSVVDRQVL